MAAALKESSRSLAGGSRQALFRKGLVAAEVALSLVLLAGAGVLLRAFIAMQHVDLNVAPEQVLTLRVPLSAEQYPDASRRIAFFHELLERIAAVAALLLLVGLQACLWPARWPSRHRSTRRAARRLIDNFSVVRSRPWRAAGLSTGRVSA